MAKKDNLVALLDHPEVKKRVDIGIILGLSGRTQIDCAIGVVERTIAELKKMNAVPDSLKEGYDCLRKDPNYAKYFSVAKPKAPLLFPEDGYKRSVHKAIYGF